jgi:bifunctional DNA-binding transcriptional regulator/antitoxin component of YhaV-PrlF toxin-antitoxin module
MGYPIKIQKVERSVTSSYYVNFPVAVAEALEVSKGESWEWLLEDKNTLVLRRVTQTPPRKLKTLLSP